MLTFTSKLIIIRGNSGSGKSTIAKNIRSSCDQKIALLEQDYLRRIVLKDKDLPNADNIDLIYQTAIFALSRHYHVILEGILTFSRYGSMLTKLIALCPDHHIFYLDVSFEETLRRHVTKPNCHEFGEEKMRSWYQPHDTTNFPGEIIISESSTFENSVTLISQQSGLK